MSVEMMLSWRSRGPGLRLNRFREIPRPEGTVLARTRLKSGSSRSARISLRGSRQGTVRCLHPRCKRCAQPGCGSLQMLMDRSRSHHGRRSRPHRSVLSVAPEPARAHAVVGDGTLSCTVEHIVSASSIREATGFNRARRSRLQANSAMQAIDSKRCSNADSSAYRRGSQHGGHPGSSLGRTQVASCGEGPMMQRGARQTWPAPGLARSDLPLARYASRAYSPTDRPIDGLGRVRMRGLPSRLANRW